MYNPCKMYNCPYWVEDSQMYNWGNMNYTFNGYPCLYYNINPPMYNYGYSPQYVSMGTPYNDKIDYNTEEDYLQSTSENPIDLKDYGPEPFVVNIEEATKQNETFRTALWTGKHLQLTLMSIPVGGEIGLERHANLDQFIRVEEGQGLVKMGDRSDRLNFQKEVFDDFIFIIPAGKWHNLINTGNKPIKLYSIYAPPQHPFGTVHETKAEAEAAEEMHGH